MGRSHTRLPTFCSTGRATVRVRVRCLLPLQSKLVSSFIRTDPKTEFSGNGGEKKLRSDGAKTGCGIGNRIMVVVDSSREAKGALQWALSHTVQSQDTVILLYVAKQCKQGAKSRRELNYNLRAYEVLCSMKNMCQMRRPGVHVEVALLEGKEKGAIIVEEAKKQRVSLLVLGQRKRSMMWRLLMMWTGNRIRGGVVDYCIQNANCMAVAVRRKSNKLGGYLITTKRHKNFWLLA
ncbi:hypothetical protein L1049_027365 [Liquidambar formosana]|uniref:UspA domain-containing protein n=1 Tax=Liquidambar formosana TaxID=63359 RepID=A0AAP0WSC4_LIQFO